MGSTRSACRGESKALGPTPPLCAMHPDEPRLQLERPLKQSRLALSVPDLHTRVGAGLQCEFDVAAVCGAPDAGDPLRVRAIETVGDAQDARQIGRASCRERV